MWSTVLFLASVCVAFTDATQFTVGIGQRYTSLKTAIHESALVEGAVLQIVGTLKEREIELLDRSIVVQGGSSAAIDCEDQSWALSIQGRRDRQPAHVIIRDLVFRNCGASQAAITVEADNKITVEFERCVFEDNKNNGNGGAFFIDGDHDPTRRHLTEDVARLSIAVVSFKQCKFLRNAAFRGGAIYVHEHAVLKFQDVDFLENKATMTGSAMELATHSNVTLRNVNFQRNHATQSGTVWLGQLALADAENVEFSDNKAEFLSGGALYLDGGQFLCQHCRLLRNQAGNAGGALYVYDGSGIAAFDYSQFLDNQARDGSIVKAQGGSSVRLRHCIADRNAANQGAAVVAAFSYINISNCEFSENTGTKGTFALSDNTKLRAVNVSVKAPAAIAHLEALWCANSRVYTDNFTSTFKTLAKCLEQPRLTHCHFNSTSSEQAHFCHRVLGIDTQRRPFDPHTSRVTEIAYGLLAAIVAFAGLAFCLRMKLKAE